MSQGPKKFTLWLQNCTKSLSSQDCDPSFAQVWGRADEDAQVFPGSRPIATLTRSAARCNVSEWMRSRWRHSQGMQQYRTRVKVSYSLLHYDYFAAHAFVLPTLGIFGDSVLACDNEPIS